MRAISVSGSVLGWLLITTQVAFAQAGDAAKKPAPSPAATKPADAPAKPAPPPAGEAMMAPRPAPEMDQLKDMIGTWKCEGKMVMGGKESKEKSTATFAWDLDKFFVFGKFEGPKTKENPAGYKGRALYGFDTGTKQFVSMAADSMGGMGMMMSRGYDGDKIEWTGKVKMMGVEMDAKETIIKKGPRETLIVGSMGSGEHAANWELTCKR